MMARRAYGRAYADMQIVSYQPAHLAGVYSVFRRVTAQVPHARLLPSMAATGSALARAEQAGAGVVVAHAGTAVRGIATHRPIAPSDDGLLHLDITGVFAPDEKTVGALLDACVVRAAGAHRIVVFGAEQEHCPLATYTAGWNGLSDRMPWVARVLARNGFAPTYRELHLACTAAQFPTAPVPAPAGITLVDGVHDHGCSIRAMAGDQEVGQALYFRLSQLSDHPEAGAWGFVDWLGVADGHRRRGLGRCLLRRLLYRLQEHGCRGCWLSTSAANWPAQALYLSLGFEIIDTSSAWRKTLPLG